MKKIVFCFLGLLAVLYTASAQSYTFNHGPYLQELSEHAVTFVFTTSDKGFSWVEVKPDGGEAERHYTVRNGLRDAYNTFNVIRVENLRPDTRYQYRLCSLQSDVRRQHRLALAPLLDSGSESDRLLVHRAERHASAAR